MRRTECVILENSQRLLIGNSFPPKRRMRQCTTQCARDVIQVAVYQALRFQLASIDQSTVDRWKSNDIPKMAVSLKIQIEPLLASIQIDQSNLSDPIHWRHRGRGRRCFSFLANRLDKTLHPVGNAFPLHWDLPFQRYRANNGLPDRTHCYGMHASMIRVLINLTGRVDARPAALAAQPRILSITRGAVQSRP